MRERGTGISSSGAPEFAAILGRFWGAFVLAPFGMLVSGFGERLFRCHSEFWFLNPIPSFGASVFSPC
jgi:hypothetical protein